MKTKMKKKNKLLTMIPIWRDPEIVKLSREGKLKIVDKKKQGKKNREAGARFERKVRAHLESKGWIIDRWGNNVELLPKKINYPDGKLWAIFKGGKLIKAKSTRFRSNTHGFPDFICYKIIKDRGECADAFNIKPFKFIDIPVDSSVCGVEVKSNGYLKPEEKEKCKWLLENNIFSKIFIAKKGKKRGEIIYEEY